MTKMFVVFDGNYDIVPILTICFGVNTVSTHLENSEGRIRYKNAGIATHGRINFHDTCHARFSVCSTIRSAEIYSALPHI